TSLAQDLYKRFVQPSASDATVLAVARWATLVCGIIGVSIAGGSEDVSRTLVIPYTLLGVSPFLPIVAGLFVRRAFSAGALASITSGVGVTLFVQFSTDGASWHGVTPALAGLSAAIAAWAISLIFDVR